MANDKKIEPEVLVDISAKPPGDAPVEASVDDESKGKKKKNKTAKQDDELAELKQQNAEAADRYLRVMAEFDNFRKRTAREKAVMHDDGVRDAVVRFLPVVDNFERAMAAVSDEDRDGGLVKGFAMILRQFKDQLNALGVYEIEAVGQPFDTNLHEAVMMAEDTGLESGHIAQELIKGYIYKDKPLRHSMVKVAQ